MASAYPVEKKVYYDLKNAPALFENFIKTYHRQYKDVDDKYIHYFAFCTNLVKINKLNRESPPTLIFGINEFTDNTEEEFHKHLGLLDPKSHKPNY
ncbi:hypothetical protein PYW07_017070 [Mythimna separata]|uniref:Cathepsin propeptide inhibitor domain-containing protein n=1 Tax=Mythimna separata TaxID=271217 RepID=A0AAD7YUM8_MYTSE|nr:hypothetical protein PYW07_017070 [Mythimna separata]